jgi:hypothetical protein
LESETQKATKEIRDEKRKTSKYDNIKGCKHEAMKGN